ncbi:Macrophage migration inhibitory factor [Gryllus bimaculatus]|nr:Macrophage migration inhibitory factor [Gryllus bimaculatus]
MPWRVKCGALKLMKCHLCIINELLLYNMSRASHCPTVRRRATVAPRTRHSRHSRPAPAAAMPMLRIETNQTRCHVPKDFHKTTTELVAKLLEKPAERCCVTVVTDLNMSRGGSTEPCGFAQLMSIGQIDEERNKRYVAALTLHLEKFLGISRKRLLIRLVDEKPENLGNCGTTYKELLQEYKPKKKKKQHGSSSESGSDSDSDEKKKKDDSD